MDGGDDDKMSPADVLNRSAARRTSYTLALLDHHHRQGRPMLVTALDRNTVHRTLGRWVITGSYIDCHALVVVDLRPRAPRAAAGGGCRRARTRNRRERGPWDRWIRRAPGPEYWPGGGLRRRPVEGHRFWPVLVALRPRLAWNRDHGGFFGRPPTAVMLADIVSRSRAVAVTILSDTVRFFTVLSGPVSVRW